MKLVPSSAFIFTLLARRSLVSLTGLLGVLGLRVRVGDAGLEVDEPGRHTSAKTGSPSRTAAALADVKT